MTATVTYTRRVNRGINNRSGTHETVLDAGPEIQVDVHYAYLRDGCLVFSRADQPRNAVITCIPLDTIYDIALTESETD